MYSNGNIILLYFYFEKLNILIHFFFILKINNLTVNDAGLYECVVTNANENNERSMQTMIAVVAVEILG